VAYGNATERPAGSCKSGSSGNAPRSSAGASSNCNIVIARYEKQIRRVDKEESTAPIVDAIAMRASRAD